MSDLEQLEVFDNEMEARMCASILEEEGIHALVKPLGMGYGGIGSNSFVPHGVYVLTEHIQNARAIIQTSEEA